MVTEIQVGKYTFFDSVQSVLRTLSGLPDI